MVEGKYTLRSDSISLILGGESIPAGDYVSAVDAFVSLIRSVSGGIASGESQIKWGIEVFKGSNGLSVYCVDPEPNFSLVMKSINAIGKGFSFLAEGHQELPEYYKVSDIKHLRTLDRIRRSGQSTVHVYSGTHALSFDNNTTVAIEQLIGGKYTSHGSVQGWLQSLSNRKGLHFNIYRSIGDQRVKCVFDPEMIDEAKAAFGKRVHVEGPVTFSQAGYPVKVKVDNLEVYPDDELLPTLEDVAGILND